MQCFSELQAIKPSSPLPCSHCKVLAFQEEEEQRAVLGRSQRTGTGRPFQAVQYASIHQTAPRDGPFSYNAAAFPQQKIPRADHQLSTGMRSRIEVMPGARSLQCRFFASGAGFLLPFEPIWLLFVWRPPVGFAQGALSVLPSSFLTGRFPVKGSGEHNERSHSISVMMEATIIWGLNSH